MGNATNQLPKSLIPLSDTSTILEKQILFAHRLGCIDEVIVICGYRAAKIEAEIEKYKELLTVKSIYNPFYENTNPLVSLWTASHELRDKDFIIINGDTIYRDSLLDKVRGIKDSMQLVVSLSDGYNKDAVKVVLGPSNSIIRVHKNLPQDYYQAESAGMLIARGVNNRNYFVNKIMDLVRDKHYLMPRVIWHEVLDLLAQDGVNIKALMVNNNSWGEVDTIDDLKYVDEQS